MNDTRFDAPEEKKSKAEEPEVKKVIERSMKMEKKQKEFGTSQIFGKSFVNKMKMDEFVVSAPARLPGVESVNWGKELLTGDDISLGFKDILGYFPSEDIIDAHTEMEKDLKILQKGKY